MESAGGAAAEIDGTRATARKPATTPTAGKRLRNVDTNMCAANDDIGIFSTSQGTRVQNLPVVSGRAARVPELNFQAGCCRHRRSSAAAERSSSVFAQE